jgi:hypothetical protein
MRSFCNLLFALTGRCAGNRRTLIGRLAALFALAFFLAHSSTDQARAVEKLSVPNGSELLKYRRVFVPADDAEAWPLDGQKFIPIDAPEFNKLISAANGTNSEAAPRATIVEATYTGRMVSAEKVAGYGTWRIELHGESPVILPLGDIPFTIREPRWRDESKRPARLGFWARRGGHPEMLGLEVARAGRVDFSWQVNLKDRPANAESAWRLPPAASSRLILDLPPTHRPLIEGGVIQNNNPSIEAAEANSDIRRWEILLGGSSNAKLRLIAATTQQPEDMPDARLRDEVAYRLDERGVNIVTTWRCEGAIRLLRELVVPLPEGVQFISAESDGVELGWQISTHGASAAPAVVIEMPNPIAHDQFAVTIRAWHPLPTTHPWRLPSLRPAGMLWVSGTLELSLSPSLELKWLSPADCVQTGVVQSPGDLAGSETHWFTAYSPTGGLELSVDTREPSVSARLESALWIRESEIGGRLTTQLDVKHGSVHKLSGELAQGWTVESVESIPDDAVGEWIVNRRDGITEIEIQLAQSPNARRPVTVRVDGRLEPTSYAEPISSETLRMVRWHGVDVAKHLLTFQAAEPYAAEPVGGLPAATSQQLVAEPKVRPDAAQATAFDLTHAPQSAAIRISLERGEFEADIAFHAELVGDEARLAYHLVARPVESRIDRLLVFANSPLGDDLRWIDRKSGAPLSAERLASTDAQRSGYPEGGELWLLRLPQPVTRPVEIIASQTRKFSARQQLPLLSLPRAVEQRGRIHVASDSAPLPTLEQSHLQPVPAPDETDAESRADSVPPVIGAYRYTPADCSDAARCPRLWMASGGSTPTDGLVARSAQIVSYFSADGRTAHRAIYHLEAADQFELLLPDGAENATASLDNRSLPLTRIASPQGQLSFHVPKHKSAAALRIQFGARQAALSTGAELRPPILDGLTLLSGEWTVRLPAEFEATSSNPWQSAEKVNWRRRLFGPLGRPGSSTPFDPLRITSGDLLAPIAVDPTDAQAATSPAPAMDFAASLPAISHVLSDSDGALPGWRTYRTAFVAKVPKPFVIANRSLLAVLAVALFLLCFVAGRWIADRHRELFVAVAATTAGLALVLPAQFAPLATGSLLGLLFSLAARRRPALETEDSLTKTWSRFSATGATALAITIFLAEGSPAQPPPNALQSDSNSSQQSTDLNSSTDAEASPSTAAIHRVLIPVDARSQAVGNKQYVGETFLRKLYELAGDDHAARAWLLTDVACEGELVERAEPRAIVAGQWKLILDLEVLARDTTISLPLRRSEATWQSAASLDGLPAEIQWDPDGRSCAIEIAEPGRYTIAIPFTPGIERSGPQNQIDLSIPAVSGGRFQLRHPVDVTGLELTGVATTTQAADLPKSFDGELDGSGRVTARWLQQPEPGGENSGLRATELQWLHVGQDRVELFVKFIVEGGVRRPETLTVEIDGPWKLSDSQDVVSDEPAEGGGGRIVRVALPPDDIDRQEVLLRWELVDARTLGLIFLPNIDFESLPVAQRWIALSCDPGLACEFVGTREAALGTAAEFQSRWGHALDTENLVSVLANPAANRTTAATVRPRLAQQSIDDALHVAAGSEGLRVYYTAEVDPGGTAQFQTTLFVSEEVQIDNVTLTRAGQEVPVRWSTTATNDVCVFYSEAVSDSHRLNVRAHAAADKLGTYKVPRIAIDTEAAGQRVQFYRADDVLVEMRGFSQTGEQENRTTDVPTANSNDRFAGAYQLSPSAFATGQLVVTPNTVRAAGRTLTAIERDSDAWWATFICRLVVEQGELGALRLRAPATWIEPLELQADSHGVVERKDLSAEQQLINVRFIDPIELGKEIEVRLRGRLAAETTALISVPDISMETEFDGRHYVIVPTSVDSQTMTWTELGVQPTELPPELKTSHAETSGRAFEITSRPIRMLLQPTPVDAAAATVRLADTSVTTGPFGGRLIVTRMVVVSRGLTECTIEVPPDQQLVRVSSEGRPTFARQLDDRRWLVPLGAAHLPQFLEIVTRWSNESPSNDGQAELVRPALLHDGQPIPVEVSLWSVGFPSKLAQPDIHGAAVVSAAEQAALRLGRLTSIAESATRSAIDLPLSDGKSWYLPWARRLSTLRQTSLETIRQLGGRDTSVLHVQSAVEEQLTDAAERIDIWLEQCDQIWSVPERDPSLPISADNLERSSWDLATSIANDWTYCVAEGDAARLVVTGLPSSVQQSRVQLGGLAAVFAIAASTIAIMRWPAGREFACRWPHGIAFLAGLAYWAFFWPSVLGLLIAAGSVWLALRPGWPGRSLRVESSTVISGEHGARSRE